ncbi:MAG: RDD family protein [Campylobacterota bacterium]|nr:RDD family protein [Campylobacterota bacterium]
MNDKTIYASFWTRLVASLLDTVILAVPIGVLVYFLSDGQWMNFEQFQNAIQMAQYGNAQALQAMPQTDMTWELLFEVLMMVIIIVFWKRWAGATPGKKILGIEVVNFEDNATLTNKQMIIRYVGYIISTLPLLIGFFMVLFRQDRRALHDLLSATAVIHTDSK